MLVVADALFLRFLFGIIYRISFDSKRQKYKRIRKERMKKCKASRGWFSYLEKKSKVGTRSQILTKVPFGACVFE